MILFFCLFAGLQFASGAGIYLLRVGAHPAATLEYYSGSLVMQEHYPERPDGFRRPRTSAGLLELHLPHMLLYGLLGFLLVHWLRSLKGRSYSRSDSVLTSAYFLACVLELTLVFFVVNPPLAVLRLVSLGALTLTGLALVWRTARAAIA